MRLPARHRLHAKIVAVSSLPHLPVSRTLAFSRSLFLSRGRVLAFSLTHSLSLSPSLSFSLSLFLSLSLSPAHYLKLRPCSLYPPLHTEPRWRNAFHVHRLNHETSAALPAIEPLTLDTDGRALPQNTSFAFLPTATPSLTVQASAQCVLVVVQGRESLALRPRRVER